MISYSAFAIAVLAATSFVTGHGLNVVRSKNVTVGPALNDADTDTLNAIVQPPWAGGSHRLCPTIPPIVHFNYKYNFNSKYNTTNGRRGCSPVEVEIPGRHWDNGCDWPKGCWKSNTEKKGIDCKEQYLRENHWKNLKMMGLADREDAHRVDFLDDEGCLKVIAERHSARLANFVLKEKEGFYRSDVCRMAQLYRDGGYYFDNDVELLEDPRKFLHCVSFASAISTADNEMLQAFLAVTPKHPIILRSLDMILEYYEGKRTIDARRGGVGRASASLDEDAEEAAGKWLGPNIMKQAYLEHTKHAQLTPGFDVKNGIRLLSEKAIPGGGRQGTGCEWAMYDDTSGIKFAYSRFLVDRMKPATKCA